MRPDRSRRPSLVPWFVLGLFLLLAGVQIDRAATVGLTGFSLDRELHVAPESRIPPGAPIRAGDRLMAVDGQTVDDLASLRVVLDAHRGGEAMVRFQGQARSRIVMAGSHLMEALEGRDAEDLIRLHGVGGGPGVLSMPAAEMISRMDELAEAGLYGEITVGDGTVEGRVTVRRGRIALPSLLLLALGFIGLCALILLRDESLEAKGRAERSPLVGGAVGGVALAAIGVLAVEPSLSLRWILHASALLLLWRCASFHQHLRHAGMAPGIGRGLLVLGPGLAGVAAALGVLLLGIGGLGSNATALAQGTAILLGAAGTVHLLDLALHGFRRTSTAAWLRPALWIATLCFAAAALPHVLPGALLAELGWAAGAVGVAVIWGSDLLLAVPGLAEPLSTTSMRKEPAPARKLLETAEKAVPDTRAYLAFGVDGAFLRLGLTTRLGDGERHARVEQCPDAWDSTLAMLLAEGGGYPRTPATEEDPFEGLTTHTGICAAVPISAGHASTLRMFLVVASSTPEDAAPIDLRTIEPLASATPAVELERELMALGAARFATAAAGATSPMPAPTDTQLQPAHPPATSNASEHDRGRSVPSPRLAEQAARAWPVDEPGALDSREWAALAPFIEDPRPTLIIGEAGGGKEFMARAIHARCEDRHPNRFVTVDAALIPSALLELELIGDEVEPGAVVDAAGGSLLVKTAQPLPDALVNALVEAAELEDARLFFAFRYTGPEEELAEHLPGAIATHCEGRRLSITPLRERPGDIQRYADWFLYRYCLQYDRVIEGLDEPAAHALRQLELPANFHDLMAILRASVIRTDGPNLSLDDLDLSPDRSEDESLTPAELKERARIEAALQEADGNKSEAARTLKMSRGKLLRRLKKLGLDE